MTNNDWRKYVALGRLMSFYAEMKGKVACKKSKQAALNMLKSVGWTGELPDPEEVKSDTRRMIDHYVVTEFVQMYNTIMQKYISAVAALNVGPVMKEQEAFLKRCNLAEDYIIRQKLMPLPKVDNQTKTNGVTEWDIVSYYTDNWKKLPADILKNIIRTEPMSDADVDDMCALYRDTLAAMNEVVESAGLDALRPELLVVRIWTDDETRARAVQAYHETFKPVTVEPVAEPTTDTPANDVVEEPTPQPTAEPEQPKPAYDICNPRYITLTEDQKFIIKHGILGFVMHKLGLDLIIGG